MTNDVRVPADAEWVPEGYLDARGHAEPEGPYGELLDASGGRQAQPGFPSHRCRRRRRDALFQIQHLLGGRMMSHTDTVQISALRTEVMIWRTGKPRCANLSPCLQRLSSGAASTSASPSGRACRARPQRDPCRVFGALANIKNVFVVDADIDISSDQQMD